MSFGRFQSLLANSLSHWSALIRRSMGTARPAKRDFTCREVETTLPLAADTRGRRVSIRGERYRPGSDGTIQSFTLETASLCDPIPVDFDSAGP